jgi:hypothetical protein
MPQTCSRCSRVNPAEAAYCYFDGSVLGGPGRNGARAPVGSSPFRAPFVFPSGRVCRTFDELALGCQEEWAAARELLRQRHLEAFLAGVGRTDLSQAAREASRYPDPDRGLDQLLGRLPTAVLESPRLHVNPQVVNLGVVQVGEDRRFELHLENRGGRLVYGTVSSEASPWLTLGDAAGISEKMFEFGAEHVLPVHVQGKLLRAGTKPIEGRLLVESNGGTSVVVVRADVPVRPFPDGVLAGALSPRQIAEKARDAPRQAAVQFANGAVARWYEQNGWTYPVTGPATKGVAAVQQFFEALGLTPPPKVEVSSRAVSLQGRPGTSLHHTLTVSTQENRPVYAHARSDQPWLEVSRARLNGRSAAIALVVSAVPDREGETLKARVLITSNGNQRFVVPVTLTIGGDLHFGQPAPLTQTSPDSPAGGRAWPRWLHALPALLLVFVLLGLLLRDVVHDSDPDAVALSGEEENFAYDDLMDTEPRLGVEFQPDNMRFGLVMLKENDPNNPAEHKRLTYKENGETNNTCIKLDGRECLFGQEPGHWARDERGVALKRVKINPFGWKSVWEYDEKVQVTQTVQIVPGEQTRLLDTYLIHYFIENKSEVAHSVGLRVMLDTYIGAEDGVPFVVPGKPGLLDSMGAFGEKEIPDYVQVLEYPDLKNPGTVAHLGLKGFRVPGVDMLEPIEKMVICHWPGSSARWDWEMEPMNKYPLRKDSCVALYWDTKGKIEAGHSRHMAFTYGLNAVASSSGAGQLGLTVGGSFRKGGEFTVTAYAQTPRNGQIVRLILPPGLTLLEGQDTEQRLQGGGEYNQVSWRVRSEASGIFVVEAVSGSVRERYQVRISSRSKSFLD